MPLTFDNTDLDNAASESGEVHESVVNTDHNSVDALKQGEPIQSPLHSTGLVFFAPGHEDSGTTAYDFSGNNNDGTYNGVTLGQTGLKGTTAPDYDGADDYTNFGDVLTSPGSSLSFRCVINADTLTSGTGYNRVFTKYPGTGGPAGAIIFDITDSNVIRFLVWGNNNAESVTGSTTLSTGTFYDIGFRFDSGNMDILVNGSVDGSGTLGESTIPSYSQEIALGADIPTGANAEQFGGRIMYPRLQTSVLSDAQFTDLYNTWATSGSLITQGKIA